MSSLTLAIIIAFLAGYVCIALESVIKVNKAAIALFMMAVCWTLFMINPGDYLVVPDGTTMHLAVTKMLEHHLGSAATTLFFLMGAMTIVEVVDQNGGFNFVRKALRTTSKRALLWRVAFLTFFLSAILDNLTTTIVMIMLLRKLIQSHDERLIYAGSVVIAANSGGAFSPIGDVTTIMLWNQGLITAMGVIRELFLPSLLSMIIPLFIIQRMLHGNLADTKVIDEDVPEDELTSRQRRTVFALGVGGLIFVPIFRYMTDLPPFMGILLVLSVLWLTTEIFYTHLKRKRSVRSWHNRVSQLLSHIDMTTILFFLGILMSVSCLEQIGILNTTGVWLNDVSGGNHYVVTGSIGLLSSIVDNVPLVAGCMGMYPVAAVGDMAVDGIFWQLLAYCAGVGGSILIIGSAAGVVVMGFENISFGWYMRRFSWIAIVGFFTGMLYYWFELTILR
ncbi:MAG: sodium:proton antiporter NhaD [Muribaculaceae bacterium]|nr:sodium:proton antiporter NhaD [Muribaculaceae bacterium]